MTTELDEGRDKRRRPNGGPSGGRRARRDAARRRWPAITAGIALAGVGIAGMSTAIASAAWTDRTWLAADTMTGTADLQGSIDGTTWLDSDDAGAIELVYPAVSDLRPGDVRALTLHVRNVGSLPADLLSTVTVDGALFTGTDPVMATVAGLPAQVAGGAAVSGTLTVTAPEWSGFEHQGESGRITISVVGSVP